MSAVDCNDPLPIHMAVAACFLLRNAFLVRQSGFIAALQIRNKTYNRSSEEIKHHEEFTRKMTLARKKFQDDVKKQQQMKLEGFNSQAAEAARLNRERERTALEDNLKEVERMRIEREKVKASVQQKRVEKYQRGKQVREQREEEKTAQCENEVQNLEEQSYGFITMENLDEKIQEAIDYEVDYNYALATDGKIITY